MALSRRQNLIIEYLKKNKFARINQLSKDLYVSTATIRRELATLKRMGLIEREHGGAVIYEMSDDVAMAVRQRDNTLDKEVTAALALPAIPQFKTVFFDNSSTALIFANLMEFKGKTIVTNGTTLALELSKNEDANVLMPGGKLSAGSNSITGIATMRFLNEMHFNVAILSASSINKNGVFESSLEQAEIKRIAIRNSTFKLLLVDKYKFNDQATYRTGDLTDYDYIVTNADDEDLKDIREIAGVRVINSKFDQ